MLCGLKVVIDAVAGPSGGDLHGIPGQMCVVGRGPVPAVPKDFSDERMLTPIVLPVV